MKAKNDNDATREPRKGVHLANGELPNPHNMGEAWYIAAFEIVESSINLFRGVKE